MQTDLGERAELCFGKSLDETCHKIPLCCLWVTHVPRRPYASRQNKLACFVQYGRYGQASYKSSFRRNNPASSACLTPTCCLFLTPIVPAQLTCHNRPSHRGRCTTRRATMPRTAIEYRDASPQVR